MGGLKALPAHLFTAGSLGPTSAGWHGPRSPSPPHWTSSQSAQCPQGLPFPEHQWLEGCPTRGRARGRLLVKFSVWGGAAAQGPPATRLPLVPCCQGAGGAGSAWGWALINLCSGLEARRTGLRAGWPEWQRSGRAADRCEVRGHACAPRCPLSRWQVQGSPLATALLECWLWPSNAGSWGQPPGAGRGEVGL